MMILFPSKIEKCTSTASTEKSGDTFRMACSDYVSGLSLIRLKKKREDIIEVEKRERPVEQQVKQAIPSKMFFSEKTFLCL